MAAKVVVEIIEPESWSDSETDEKTIEKKTTADESDNDYVKVLSDTLSHHNFQYQEGLNVDSNPFVPFVKCGAGLYFTKRKYMFRFAAHGTKFGKITLPAGAQKVKESRVKYKADKVILSDIKDIQSLEGWSDPGFCEQAFRQSHVCIRFIPVQYLTAQMCKSAVLKAPFLLAFIPSDYQTYELCEWALRRQWALRRPYPMYKIIPDKFKNDFHLQHIALISHRRNIKYMQQTPELCELAVSLHGGAIKYVDPKLVTYDICKKALQTNGLALAHLPREFYCEEFYHLAVSHTGWAIKYVPKAHQTVQLVQWAMLNCPKALRCVDPMVIPKKRRVEN